jgi:hypothetical protein
MVASPTVSYTVTVEVLDLGVIYRLDHRLKELDGERAPRI